MVTTEEDVMWLKTLPPGTSTEDQTDSSNKGTAVGKGKRLNVCTNSWYVFGMVLVIYKEMGLLTAEGKAIKNKHEILDILQAIWLLQEIAIIHCPGHQKG